MLNLREILSERLISLTKTHSLARGVKMKGENIFRVNELTFRKNYHHFPKTI